MFGKRSYGLINWSDESEFKEDLFEKLDDKEAPLPDFFCEETMDQQQPIDEFEEFNSDGRPWINLPETFSTDSPPSPITVPEQPVVHPPNNFLNISWRLVAAESRQCKAGEKLVQLGAKGKQGNSLALWYAIVGKEWDTVECLIRGNVCDVNIHPPGTQTVLWHLAKSHRWKLVEMLLINNVITEINNCSPKRPCANFTALDFANRSKAKSFALETSRRLLKEKGGVANVILEPFLGYDCYFYPENKRKKTLQQPVMFYRSDQSTFFWSPSGPFLSAKAPAWTKYREKMPGSLAEWLDYFYKITENINSQRGEVNCYHCAFKTNEYLAHGFIPGEAPVATERMRSFFSHEQRRSSQVYCENQSLVSICPIDHTNRGIVEDLTQEDKEVIEVDLTEEKQGTLSVKFLKTTGSHLLDRLIEMPKRQKDGTSYGFLYLKHNNNIVSHIINYFVTPDNAVIFIDAQYHQNHPNKYRRVMTNLAELLFMRYRDDVAYINAMPPEGFAIKKEAGVHVEEKGIAKPAEIVVKKEPIDEASYPGVKPK